MNGTHERPSPRDYRGYFLLVCLLAAGFVLRTLHIAEECPWLDELFTLQFIGSPGLSEFLTRVRPLNVPIPPVYLILEFFTAQLCSDPILGLRLLSLGLGMAALVWLYCLGRDLHSRSVGMIAVLCLALNPAHIYHSQEIRVYGLMVLLAIGSAHTFILWSRSWGWCIAILHFLINGLLLWTHPFAAFFLSVEFGILLLFHRSRVRDIVLWTAACTLAVVSLAWWLRGGEMNHLMHVGLASWAQTPSLFDLGKPTSLAGTYALLLGGSSKILVQTTLGTKSALTILQAVLILATGLSLVLSLVPVMLRPGHYLESLDAPVRPRELQEYAWCVFLWCVLPITLLAILSRVYTPMLAPRYLLYVSPGVALAIGLAVVVRKRSWLSHVLLAGYIGLLVLQIPYVTQHPFRSRFDQVAECITSSQWPNAPVVALSGPCAWTMNYYLHGDVSSLDAQVRYSDTERELRDGIAQLMSGGTPAVWLVAARNRRSIQEALSGLGVTVYYESPSSKPMWLYLVTRERNAASTFSLKVEPWTISQAKAR